MAPDEPPPVEDIEPVELSVLVPAPAVAPLLVPALPPNRSQAMAMIPPSSIGHGGCAVRPATAARWISSSAARCAEAFARPASSLAAGRLAAVSDPDVLRQGLFRGMKTHSQDEG